MLLFLELQKLWQNNGVDMNTMDNLKQVINHLDYETQLDKARVLIELRRLEIKRRKND